MKPEFTAIAISEPVILSSVIAASVGGKVTRTKLQAVYRVRCLINKSVFVSQKKYATLQSANNAANRLNQGNETQ